MQPDFRWSFSQWESYNSCPARWNFQSVLKLPRLPPGPAAARGLEIHKTVEEYICGKSFSYHPAIADKYRPVFDMFRDHPNGERHVEYKMSLTQAWEPAGGFNATNSWCKLVIDALRIGGPWVGPDKGEEALTAWVAEWKSGKPKDTHGDQRKLYTLAVICKWPWVEEVQTTTYYLEDTEVPQRLKVANTEANRQKLKDLWEQRIDLMRSDRFLAPKPGQHCNWCDYAKKRGGPCDFGA